LCATSEEYVYLDNLFFHNVYFNCKQLKVFASTKKELDVLIDFSEETISATRALDVAASSSFGLFRYQSPKIPATDPSIAVRHKSKPKAGKKATFALDHDYLFEGPRKYIHHRTRKSYKAGRHARPPTSQWLNTSQTMNGELTLHNVSFSSWSIVQTHEVAALYYQFSKVLYGSTRITKK
jgi:hypothetical protein